MGPVGIISNISQSRRPTDRLSIPITEGFVWNENLLAEHFTPPPAISDKGSDFRMPVFQACSLHILSIAWHRLAD
jgi:hypothetical protein